ncbi:hemerythrin domain-containing protein [Rubellimicrobium rubrum]|uniref:Hemerythrin domain-containing protein n=1 Tax=Rubellimicrobium rubrum TaxID=2585369 RepID=A0A5C4MU53_9RHOB|nr:hemerythrin domain-containing protein [Rubellimicrobium rubrum]TNC49596.1 hemerythrin domain-containing protein [Rubellimicrobium rubrum]
MPQSRSIASTEPAGLLADLDACFAEQDSLCRSLEELADSLPERLNTLGAVLLVGRLSALLRRAHHLEETQVFPILASAPVRMHGDLRPILNRLRAEHTENEDYALDLEDTLAEYWARPVARADAERLGYLLRGLFISLRRHVAQDRDWVRPLLRELGAP